MKKFICFICLLLCIGAAQQIVGCPVHAAAETAGDSGTVNPDQKGDDGSLFSTETPQDPAQEDKKSDGSGAAGPDQTVDENALFSTEPQKAPDQKDQSSGNSGTTSSDPTIDEGSLFSGDTTIVQDQKVVNDNVTDELKEKHIGFSGEFNGTSTYNKYDSNRDWFASGVGNYLLNDFSANFFVDIRLNQGVKGFLSASLDYYPTLNDQIRQQLGLANNQSTIIGIKEFFIDDNWKNKVYARVGKQVLKWGQGYFWNPTDLINVERKDFSDMDKLREGTFGAKVSIPNGTKSNTYFFVDMDEAQTVNDFSLSGKYEFLVKDTEMSVSARVKNSMAPVFGFDITGRLWDLDCRGEISLADGSNYRSLNYDTLQAETKNGYIPQVSVGFTKTFDNGDIKDRISFTPEFYYNQAGYDQNILQRIQNESSSTLKSTARTFYTNNYQQYGNSKYYLAVFSSVSKFLISNLTLNVNGISNLVDHSGTLSAGVTYQPTLSDIEYSATLTGYFGDQYTEATARGNTFGVSVGVKIKF